MSTRIERVILAAVLVVQTVLLASFATWMAVRWYDYRVLTTDVAERVGELQMGLMRHPLFLRDARNIRGHSLALEVVGDDAGDFFSFHPEWYFAVATQVTGDVRSAQKCHLVRGAIWRGRYVVTEAHDSTVVYTDRAEGPTEMFSRREREMAVEFFRKKGCPLPPIGRRQAVASAWTPL